MVESTTTASSSPSPSAANKRNRDPEDEAYLDNFHSHKRYLSEIMASSLNGLTVGESMSADNIIESPVRSETMIRDDISLQYSPMSEDFDDARYSETPLNVSMTPSDSLATSPGSPHRNQRPMNGSSLTGPRQRGSDCEGRFPSSPSDICHSADLRRAALLRSVQMRVQPAAAAPSSYDDLTFSPDLQNMEAEDESCSCTKSCPCQKHQHVFAEECSSVKVPESELRVMHMNVKEELCEEAFGRHDLLSSRRSILGGNTQSRLDSNK